MPLEIIRNSRTLVSPLSARIENYLRVAQEHPKMPNGDLRQFLYSINPDVQLNHLTTKGMLVLAGYVWNKALRTTEAEDLDHLMTEVLASPRFNAIKSLKCDLYTPVDGTGEMSTTPQGFIYAVEDVITDAHWHTLGIRYAIEHTGPTLLTTAERELHERKSLILANWKVRAGRFQGSPLPDIDTLDPTLEY